MLRGRREAAGLTREQLAVFAGVSSRTVLRAELGQVTPTQATLRVLADVLNCSPYDFVDSGALAANEGSAKDRRGDRRDAEG